METPEITPFGGVAGRIVRESLGFETFLSGIVLAFAAGLSAWWFRQFNADLPAALALHLFPLLFLARFALNGNDGEWRGTIFSSRGGGVLDVARVAGRQALLMVMWCLPLALLLRGQSAGDGGLRASLPLALVSGDRTILLLGLLYLIASVLTPPVFLIGAVSAQRTVALFHPLFWRGLFHGRLGDLFLVYAVYLGAILCVVLPAIPIVVLLALRNRETGLLAAAGVGVFAAGFALNLLGRLCGFFSATHVSGTISWGFGTPTPESSSASGAAREPIRRPDLPHEEAVPLPVGPGHLGRITTPSGKGPLLDARERVTRLQDLASSDPRRALTELEDLDREFAPHPLVLHALSRLRFRLGPEEEALAAADRALEVLIGRGHLRLAAEVYRDMRRARPRDGSAGLRRDDRLSLAEEIRGMGDISTAVEIWRGVLQEDPRERRAVKALIQVAEGMTRNPGQAGTATELLKFLLEVSPESPLRSAIEQGLIEAERRAGRVERRSA
jgi:hypothetical protein